MSLRATGVAGSLAGVVILMVSLVAGYLAAGAMQLRALTGTRTVPTVHGALVTTAGHWALVAHGAHRYRRTGPGLHSRPPTEGPDGRKAR